MFGLIKYPNEILKRKTVDIPAVTPEVQKTILTLVETMYGNQGIGLAANQVGLDWNLFVMVDPEVPEGGMAFVNPCLEDTYGEWDELSEQCLSVPGVSGRIRRRNGVRIRYLDFRGEPQTRDFSGLPARIIQHEMDHLSGLTIVTRMETADRLKNREALRRLETRPREIYEEQ